MPHPPPLDTPFLAHHDDGDAEPVDPPDRPGDHDDALTTLFVSGGALVVAGGLVTVVGVATQPPDRGAVDGDVFLSVTSRLAEVVGGISLGAGAVCLVVAGVALADDRSDPRRHDVVSVRPVVGPGQVGVVGRF